MYFRQTCIEKCPSPPLCVQGHFSCRFDEKHFVYTWELLWHRHLGFRPKEEYPWQGRHCRGPHQGLKIGLLANRLQDYPTGWKNSQNSLHCSFDFCQRFDALSSTYLVLKSTHVIQTFKSKKFLISTFSFSTNNSFLP